MQGYDYMYFSITFGVPLGLNKYFHCRLANSDYAASILQFSVRGNLLSFFVFCTCLSSYIELYIVTKAIRMKIYSYYLS